MNKKWFDETTKEEMDFVKEISKKIIKNLDSFKYMNDDKKKEIKKMFVNGKYEDAAEELLNEIKSAKDFVAYRKWLINNRIYELMGRLLSISEYKELLDSDPIQFNGDIIIIDPEFIFKTPQDAIAAADGMKMQKLGFEKVLSCKCFGKQKRKIVNNDTLENIGNVNNKEKGDIVSVFDLKELLKYNNNFQDDSSLNEHYTKIRHFKGTIQYQILKDETYDDVYHTFIIGKGINRISGEPLNFNSVIF